MNNFTTNTYEMKREIINFTKKVTNGLDKPTTKFVMDMQYGISKSKNTLISEISRSLNENIDIKNTIERLCDNLSSLDEEKADILKIII